MLYTNISLIFFNRLDYLSGCHAVFISLLESDKALFFCPSGLVLASDWVSFSRQIFLNSLYLTALFESAENDKMPESFDKLKSSLPEVRSARFI